MKNLFAPYCGDFFRDKLDLIAQALMEKETLSAQELKEIVFGEEKTESEEPFMKDPPNPPPVPVELVKREVEPPEVPDASTPTPV